MTLMHSNDWKPPRGFYKVQKNLTKKKRNRRYLDHIVAFDIETTRLPDIDQSIMYIWQMCFDAETTIYGRTWKEFFDTLYKLRSSMHDNHTIIIWVHNLSYEFQFLAGFYQFQPDEVFCVKSRKILRATMWNGQIEFRCSYLQSGLSLDAFTRDMGVQHSKLTGTFDYDKIRYPWTELTNDELAYCVHDVVGLCEAMRIEMDRDDDNLYTIPLTSTGYVRRDAKEALENHRKYTTIPDVYVALREAFRGGNTHANRFYASVILPDVHSADRSSSYPAVQVTKHFPISNWRKDNIRTAEDIERYHQPILMRVQFDNIRLSNPMWGCPYLTIDKGRNLIDIQPDNGRILTAKHLETTITDVDWKIIKDEYTWDKLTITDSWTNTYGYLPDCFRRLINTYYTKKTTLKGVEGQELYYGANKAKLNSLYGMTAQDPCKSTVEFDGSYEEVQMPNEAIETKLTDQCLPYAWGVWTTAWARLELEEGIRNVGEDFVYCDTDSVKYINDHDWSNYNTKRIRDAKANGAYATDPKSITHYMGVFEQEDDYDRFITMGAKKYAYEQDGKLGITVAGVAKKDGAVELGKLENFKTGFTFSIAGGLESVYNDTNYGWYTIDDKKIYITRNICLRPSTYKLGLGNDYAELIETISKHALTSVSEYRR